jgi:hypothetical protein
VNDQPHTSHPCRRDTCTSRPRFVLVDPEHDGSGGYDAIRVSVTEWRVLVGTVSRTFGADTFDTEAAALEHLERTRELAATKPEPASDHALALLDRAVPTEWGSVHQLA